ncbi:hypothetical protein EUX98_g225 [Antrodiella citrinella]|uniref:Uncharacterized protein n=1 Tax=Antrodiella citrinella TaxID=2447956 RepID=A0A4S4N668_9APHY|nr:hypothetical protein EUX98_g225 [Antrodiella citrinella]
MPPLPAHHTKHVQSLAYPFRHSSFLINQLDDGATNGTALWLGAQCLAMYLADLYATKPTSERPQAVELGSGVGLTALALASMGWDVLATDLPQVIHAVLSANIAANASRLHTGSVHVRILDWTVPPDTWSWSDAAAVAHASASQQPALAPPTIAPPFQLIISADTVYSPALITPFLRTLHALSALSFNASNRAPPVYICLERRDPAIADRTLTQAKEQWDFSVERVPHRKLQKAMKKGGLNWDPEDWEGIEIWKLVLQSR